VVSTSLPETPANISSGIPDTVTAIGTPCLVSLTTLAAAAVDYLELELIAATIKRWKVMALLDSGASDLYLSAEIARRICLEPSSQFVKVTLVSD